MRKLTAILLLLVFFLAQYERYIGYLNCRVANYFATEESPCNCESLLEDSDTSFANNTAPAKHIHLHPDESYFAPLDCHWRQYFFLRTNFSVFHSPHLRLGNISGIDHPPQAG